MKTLIWLNNSRDFKVVERGDIGTIDLLTVLNTLKHGFIKDAKKIDSNKSDSAHSGCRIEIWPEQENVTDIRTGKMKATEIASCLEQVMVKYAREIVGEVEELQGILKGKDLERYLDLMIEQNKSKGNRNN